MVELVQSEACCDLLSMGANKGEFMSPSRLIGRKTAAFTSNNTWIYSDNRLPQLPLGFLLTLLILFPLSLRLLLLLFTSSFSFSSSACSAYYCSVSTSNQLVINLTYQTRSVCCLVPEQVTRGRSQTKTSVTFGSLWSFIIVAAPR